MPKQNRVRHIFTALLLALAFIVMMNIGTSINVGVDWHYRHIKMPLYIKWTQFLARHYEYARLVGEITAGCRSDEDKALAILAWTRANLKDVPQGMSICDDHILYIIIRGYGIPEQFQDVFTTLCVYSKVPAFYGKAYDKNHRTRYTLSFVKLDRKWRVFDAYYGKYFRNAKGEIASIDDIVNDFSIINNSDQGVAMVGGVPYKEYYSNLKAITVPQTLRAETQMPLQRILYEAKKVMKIEKLSDDAK